MGMNNMDNYMEQMAVLCENNDSINKNLYSEYGVKRGLRDENGAHERRDQLQAPAGRSIPRHLGSDGNRQIRR